MVVAEVQKGRVFSALPVSTNVAVPTRSHATTRLVLELGVAVNAIKKYRPTRSVSSYCTPRRIVERDVRGVWTADHGGRGATRTGSFLSTDIADHLVTVPRACIVGVIKVHRRRSLGDHEVGQVSASVRVNVCGPSAVTRCLRHTIALATVQAPSAADAAVVWERGVVGAATVRAPAVFHLVQAHRRATADHMKPNLQPRLLHSQFGRFEPARPLCCVQLIVPDIREHSVVVSDKENVRSDRLRDVDVVAKIALISAVSPIPATRTVWVQRLNMLDFADVRPQRWEGAGRRNAVRNAVAGFGKQHCVPELPL